MAAPKNSLNFSGWASGLMMLNTQLKIPAAVSPPKMPLKNETAKSQALVSGLCWFWHVWQSK